MADNSFRRNEELDELQEAGYSVYYISKKLHISEEYIMNYTAAKTGRRKEGYNPEIHPEHNYLEKQRDLVYKLYTEEGKDISEISTMMGYPVSYTRSMLYNRFEKENDNGEQMNEAHTKILDENITIYKLEEFKRKILPGDRFKIRTRVIDGICGEQMKEIEVLVLVKYPYIVSTTKGDFQYLDLYMGTPITD